MGCPAHCACKYNNQHCACWDGITMQKMERETKDSK